jgi:hypothetical protein
MPSQVPISLDGLQPGDIMLYHPPVYQWKKFWNINIFSKAIAIKTWHNISHVEIYDGNNMSWASRDGKGFDHYPVRTTELAYVLRPLRKLNLAVGRSWATSMIGTPYGWLDLLNFVGAPVDKKGIVCSPAAAGYLRACGWNVFPMDPINKIAPFQFLDLVEDGVCEKIYENLS